MLIVIIFSLLIFNSIFSQGFIYPTLPSDEITDMLSVSENEILFINNGGSIFKSYDEGYSWELKKHFQGIPLEKFYTVSDGTIFIKPSQLKIGDPIGIVYSYDKGESWSSQKISLNNAIDVLPLSNNIILKSTKEGDIQTLDNFFNSWQTVYSVPTFTDSLSDLGPFEVPYGHIKSFELLPSGDVLALGINNNAASKNILNDSLTFILQNIDEGVVWDTLWLGLNSFGNLIKFSDNNNGWLTTSDRKLYRTTDGGNSWDIVDSIYFNQFSFNNILTIDSSRVFLFDYRGKIIYTEDSGKKWDEIHADVTGSFEKLYTTSNNTLFIYGYDFIRSTDFGKKWSKVDSSLTSNIIDIDFISLTEGIALGNNGIYKSYDGGKSWKFIFNPHELHYNIQGNICMINDSGWLVTQEKIFKTKDRGESWEEVILSSEPERYNGVVFHDKNLGIIYDVAEAINDQGTIFESKKHYLTLDGGDTWETINIGISSDSKYFSKVKFTDPEHLFALNRKALWVSNDTAKTFTKLLNTDVYTGDFTFDFYDSYNGVFSINNYIFVTNDGGKTWSESRKEERLGPLDLTIMGSSLNSDKFRLVEAGQEGKVRQYYLNQEGAISYSRDINSYTKKSLNKIVKYVENDLPNIWIAGHGFTILHRIFEKVTTSISSSKYLEASYDLFANYPNPFNPTTTIKYSLAKPDYTNLVVYNMLGEQVLTLVNEYQNSGQHQIKFDASHLPSGVYIYSLKSGEFVSSKKMILLK